jgi:hypothetical protein
VTVTSVALLRVPICILLWGQVTWSDYQHRYFSTQSCKFAKTRHLPEQNVTSNIFHTISTHNDGHLPVSARPFCPVSSAPLNTCMTYTVIWRYFMRSECMHCSMTSLCCRRCNVMTLTSWSRRNLIHHCLKTLFLEILISSVFCPCQLALVGPDHHSATLGLYSNNAKWHCLNLVEKYSSPLLSYYGHVLSVCHHMLICEHGTFCNHWCYWPETLYIHCMYP